MEQSLVSEATLTESESKSSDDSALLTIRDDRLRFETPAALLGGWSLVLSGTLLVLSGPLLVAEREAAGGTGLLGRTAAAPSVAFPRSADLS